jgi:hypothetical protein
LASFTFGSGERTLLMGTNLSLTCYELAFAAATGTIFAAIR